MSKDKGFDGYYIKSDNGNNVDNDANVEVIRKEDLKRINDPDCVHQLERDDSDVLGDQVAWVCRKCGRGTFLPKTVTKIT